MGKMVDDYSVFKVATVKPKAPPKRRRFQMSLLVWLAVGWVLLLLFRYYR